MRPPQKAPGQSPAAEKYIVISARGAKRLRSGHPWVYRSDIVSAEGVPPGVWAEVREVSGRSWGTALYSSSSQIAVRMLSAETLSDEQGQALLRQRIREAVELRRRVVRNADAYRVIFSEADFLPGLIVDRYNDVLSLQILTQAMDTDRVRQIIVDELVRHFSPAGVVERVEEHIRELEQLPPRLPGLLHGQRLETVFSINGVRFRFSGLEGQKTGAFLDQRENYAAAARYAWGQALDVFCYQGGFALHLLPVCDAVTGVDSSRAALEAAEQNAALNGREMEWIEANAFDLLKDYAGAGRKFDTIVLDPPAFAKTRRNVPAALRGYKELNLRALKMLRSKGLLVTCSCSYHVSEADFLQMLASAALDAGRQVRIIERRSQARDHPILLTMPESQYLKCVVAIVS
jgi:23S rRNA (cytosine1962-C5)-methyltransferase